ncbi:MAG: ribosome biogenesis GTPase Der, partial [Clostridia bacterium]|nr:ribosome biogenesis GTPase Der [Clostridia bacterium]
HIRRQAELALDIADVILFFVDGKTGIMSDDYDVAQMLRCTNKPVVLAVNNVDGKDDSVIHDFWALNLGEPMAISSEQSLGLGDLLDAVCANFERNDADAEEETIKIAIVGKPNSGKSSLTNRLLGFERVIVSNIAGTTRDAIDTPFEYNDKKCTLIDTAGIRKKSKVEEDVEYYSVIRSISAIRRADIVLIVVDSMEMLSEQDIRICGLVHDAGKPSVLVMNKWDLIEKDTYTVNRFTEKLQTELKFMTYLKTVFISALTGKRVNTVLDTAMQAYENASRRIPTGVLNDVIGDAIAVNEPPTHNGKRLKIFYSSQPSTNPPTFVMFVNDGKLMHFSYKRYIENSLRKAFDFSGTPVKIVVRSKDEDKQ